MKERSKKSGPKHLKDSVWKEYLPWLEILSVSFLFSRKLKIDDEESAENWYDCLIPNCFKSCAKIFQCCKVPRFITDFQAKLKEAKPSRIRKNWRQQNCLTFLGFLFLVIINLIIICFKPVKFLTFDVVFPAVDVYTDSDAAIKHFA